MASFLRVFPDVGATDLEVEVHWELHDDVPWSPGLNDELRLVTSTGTVVARSSIYEGYKEQLFEGKKLGDLRTGKCKLICPPFTGGFVLTIMDYAGNRRVLSTPFRVAGPPINPKIGFTIHGNVRIAPFGRIDVSCAIADLVESAGDDEENGKIKDFVICIVEKGKGDNNGFEDGKGLYEHAANVVAAPKITKDTVYLYDLDTATHTVSFIAPERCGTYQIRCMATPKCGVPYTKFVSNAFDITDDLHFVSGEEELRKTIQGTLKSDRTKYMVGETLKIKFDVTVPCGHLLNPLDKIVLYPYGRSEGIHHHGALVHCIRDRIFSGTIEIEAPAVEGFYDLAYFSHADQRPVINAEPVVIHQPHAELTWIGGKHGKHLNLKNMQQGDMSGATAPTASTESPRASEKLKKSISSLGETHECEGELTVQYSIEASAFSNGDRIVVMDDLANVVASSFVEKPKRRKVLDGPPASGIGGAPGVTSPPHGRTLTVPENNFRGSVKLSTSVGGRSESGTPNESCNVSFTAGAEHDADDDRRREDSDSSNHHHHGKKGSVASSSTANTPAPSEVFIGFAKTTVFLKGKYSLRYYSAKLKRILCKMDGFASVAPPPSSSLPTANLTAIKDITQACRVPVSFTKEGNDTRTHSEIAQDCVCIYPGSCRDHALTADRDDASAAPALATFYLRGAAEATWTFPPIEELLKTAKRNLDGTTMTGVIDDENDTTVNGRPLPASALQPITRPREFSLRYMISVQGHFMRVCISECNFTVHPEDELPTFRLQPLKNVSLQELAPVNQRFMYDDADEQENPMAQDAAASSEAGSSRSGSLQSSSQAYSRSHGSFRYGSVASGSVAGFSTTSGGGGRRKKDQAKAFSSFLHMSLNETEFQGVVLQPRVCSTTDQVVITYHLTGGVARSDDKIVLFNDDCTLLVSEVPVSLGSGRSDYSLGTVILNPPKTEGKYIAGYFSEKHKTIVLASETFRVSQGVGSFLPSGAAGIVSLIHSEDSINNEGAMPRMLAPQSLAGKKSLLADIRKSSTLVDPSMRRERKLKSTQRRARTRIVIVAVAYMKQYFELRGPLNDAELFLKTAKSTFFPRDAYLNDEEHEKALASDILVLHELQTSNALKPTASNIRDALRWLVDGAYPKDHLIFYFSGCGTNAQNGERALLPCDYDWGARNITYSDLAEQVYNRVPNGVAVSCLIDACYSSNMVDVCGQKNIWRETSTTTARNIPLGMKMLWQRREKRGIPAKTPWRSVDPPQGVHCSRTKAFMELPAADPACYSHAMNDMLFQPYNGLNTAAQTSGSNRLFVLYEASRGNPHAAHGASDVFVSSQGCTLGLFTYAICEALKAATEISPFDAAETELLGTPTDNSDHGCVCWWELHERVRRFITTTVFKDQNPRLLVGDYSSLDEHVAFVAAKVVLEEEEEEGDDIDGSIGL